MAVDFLGALGAGSDIDTKSLVESLVAAERAPKESLINRRIDTSEAEISAYGIVMASLESLDLAFNKLNDANDFAEYSVTASGNETASGSMGFTISATADASPGITSVAVNRLASVDRWGSDSLYSGLTTELNGGATFSLTFTDSEGNNTAVAVTDTTPQGVVDTINDADLGIEASIVDTGLSPGRYKIVLTSALGADSAFTVSSSATNGTTLAFNDHLSTATDAQLVVNGVTAERATNTVTDLVDGVTLNLLGVTAATGVVSVSQSTTAIKDRIQELVDTYNAVREQFEMLSDPDSAEDLGGSLSGDSGFESVYRQIKGLFSDPSSTPSDNFTYLSEIGIAFDRYGRLEIEESRLDVVLSESLSEVVTLFSADTNNQSNFGDASRGIAGDAIKALSGLMDPDGPVLSRQSNLESRVADYREDLDDLDQRMERIYQRYLAQFTVMEQAIDEMNSTKSYLETALSALPFTNRDK